MLIQNYKDQIKELAKKIEAIQAACSHPEEAVMVKYHCNSGHYDPSNDTESYTFYCTLCEYQWYESHEYGCGNKWKPENEKWRYSRKTLKWDETLRG